MVAQLRAEANVRDYVAAYGGVAVDNTGTLYTLCEHSAVINAWDSDGAFTGRGAERDALWHPCFHRGAARLPGAGHYPLSQPEPG